MTYVLNIYNRFSTITALTALDWRLDDERSFNDLGWVYYFCITFCIYLDACHIAQTLYTVFSFNIYYQGCRSL